MSLNQTEEETKVLPVSSMDLTIFALEGRTIAVGAAGESVTIQIDAGSIRLPCLDKRAAATLCGAMLATLPRARLRRDDE